MSDTVKSGSGGLPCCRFILYFRVILRCSKRSSRSLFVVRDDINGVDQISVNFLEIMQQEYHSPPFIQFCMHLTYVT